MAISRRKGWAIAFVLAGLWGVGALANAGRRAVRNQSDWRLLGRAADGRHVWLDVRRPTSASRRGASWWGVRVTDAATAPPAGPSTDVAIDCARREVSRGDLPGRTEGLHARAVALVCDERR